MTVTEALESSPISPEAKSNQSSFMDSFFIRLRFRFYLPNVRRTNLAGVKLDLRGLSSMMKNVILTGRYESEERSLCSKVLGPEDVVLELGSAIGFVGLFCRKALRVKHVTGVEANPATLAMLRRNYARNRMVPNVIEAAAAAEDGVLELDVSGEFWENSIEGDSNKTVTVPALSLPSIFAKLEESPTALICDIEGAEKYLDFKSLPESVKTIVIELHPAIIGEEEVAGILNGLKEMGFVLAETQGGTALLQRCVD